MKNQVFTVADVRRLLREAAGENDAQLLASEIEDITFERLGYDSLALLEAGTRLELELDIKLDDSAITDVETPRDLVTVVNDELDAVRVG